MAGKNNPIKVCGCSIKESKNAEDLIRDLINLISIYKKEEMQDVTTRIEPATAKELVKELEKIAKKIGDVCQCK